MQCWCYVRNITEAKDFKGGESSQGVVWYVGEVLRTSLETVTNRRTGGLDYKCM